MVADDRSRGPLNRLKSRQGRSSVPILSTVLTSKESCKGRAGTPESQGEVKLRAKAGKRKCKKMEIEVILIRPEVPDLDALDEVYKILVASELGQ